MRRSFAWASAVLLGVRGTAAVRDENTGGNQGKLAAFDDKSCKVIAEQAKSQEEPCGLPEGDKRLMWLGSSGVPAAEKDAFLSLLKALPEHNTPSTAKVVVVYDTALFKESFWNTEHEAWKKPGNSEQGMTFQKLSSLLGELTPELMSGYFGGFKGPAGETLDGGWSYDEKSPNAAMGGLGGLGFQDPTQLSILGKFLKAADFKLLAKLMLGLDVKAAPELGKELLQRLQNTDTSSVEQMVEEADVWWVAGGNPDLIAFVYEAFPRVKEKLIARVKAGKMLYVGRSAGAMVAAPNAGFSAEPTVATYRSLFPGVVTGLGLLPTCLLKPHFVRDNWEMYSELVEEESSYHVVRVPNGMALRCEAACCYQVGSNEQAETWSPGKEHLKEFFDSLPPKKKEDKSASQGRSLAALAPLFALAAGLVSAAM